MGIYPATFKDFIDPSVAQIVAHQQEATGHAARTAATPSAQIEASR
jgi:hypothetical protein